MEDFFKKALEKKEMGTCTQSMQMKTPPPVLPITAAKKPRVFYETLFNRKSDKSPKHKTHFPQRESTKLEPQGLKITFSQMQMGKETSKFFSICCLWRKKGRRRNDGTRLKRKLKVNPLCSCPASGVSAKPVGTVKVLLWIVQHQMRWKDSYFKGLLYHHRLLRIKVLQPHQ